MAYASLGIVDRQENIWEAIQLTAHWKGSSMQKLTQNAIAHGLAATRFRSRDPWTLALSCSRHGFPMIVNHRLRADTAIGHFSVLDAVASDVAQLYDPLEDATRSIRREQLLELWLTRDGDRNPGAQLLVLGRPTGSVQRCRKCGRGINRRCRCAGCNQQVAVEFTELLECTAGCSARTWESVYCPHCDAEMTALSDDPYSAESLFASLGFRATAEGKN